MGKLYVDTGGAATNSGSSDSNTPDLSGTSDAVVTGSTVQLTIGTDLSAVDAVAGSATQASIYIADATNSNQKIFWITGKNDGLDQVTVSVAPTGVTASNWAIGGRHLWTPASIEAALRAGDILQFNNSPASRTAAFLTQRASGDTTSGYVKYIGKTGTRPVLTITNTTQVFTSGALTLGWVENFELAQQGASGIAANVGASGGVFYNVKISDAGAQGWFTNNSANRIIGCEISGTGAEAISLTSQQHVHIGNYVHDITGDGILYASTANTSLIARNNIVDTCTGRGIYINVADSANTSFKMVSGNTVYGCGNSGLEVVDADSNVILINNIFSENGNAAGEYNVEWVAGNADFTGFHAWNVFFHSSGAGSNVSGLTIGGHVASSELITDPLFTNATGGDFSIGSTSPAKAVGYPGVFLGGSTGYLDIGAVQRQEPTGGGNRVIGG